MSRAQPSFTKRVLLLQEIRVELFKTSRFELRCMHRTMPTA